MKYQLSEKDLSRIKTALVYFAKELKNKESILEYINTIGLFSDVQEHLSRNPNKIFLVVE